MLQILKSLSWFYRGVFPIFLTLVAIAMSFSLLLWRGEGRHSGPPLRVSQELSQEIAQKGSESVYLYFAQVLGALSQQRRNFQETQQVDFTSLRGAHGVFILDTNPVRILLSKDDLRNPMTITENREVGSFLESWIGEHQKDKSIDKFFVKNLRLQSQRVVTLIGMLDLQEGIFVGAFNPSLLFDPYLKMDFAKWVQVSLVNSECEVIYHTTPNRIGKSYQGLKVCALLPKQNKAVGPFQFENFEGVTQVGTLFPVPMSLPDQQGWMVLSEVDPRLGNELSIGFSRQEIREYLYALGFGAMVSLIFTLFFWTPFLKKSESPPPSAELKKPSLEVETKELRRDLESEKWKSELAAFVTRQVPLEKGDSPSGGDPDFKSQVREFFREGEI